MKKKQMLIITENNYPEGDAGAVRQHCFAKLFTELDYDVHIACLDKDSYLTSKEYDGIKYVSFRKPTESIILKSMNYLRFFSHITSYYKKEMSRFELILVIGITPCNMMRLKRYCKKNDVALLHDCVEWYSPEEFKLKQLSPSYISKNILNSIMIDHTIKVVSISSYLNDYFLRKNINSIRVPVIMDVKGTCPNFDSKNKRCTFVYAGNPGNKDKLLPVIQAMSKMPQELLNQMELIIIGIDTKSLANIVGLTTNELNELGESLNVKGRLSRKDTIEHVRNADFSILFRDETLKFAKAGFPTKVVEAMSLGTPMCCNLSSDLEMYLNDKINAIISEDSSTESVLASLTNAIEIKNGGNYSNLRKNAYDSALSDFDYRNYKEAMNNLIKAGDCNDE